MPRIAEGIEDENARSHLAERGCDFGQGYLFSRAFGAASVMQMMDKRNDKMCA